MRNERRQSVENRPYGLADEAVTQLLLPPGHPYYADVIGSHADIQAAKLDDVKKFFKQYYAPNNASLAIVGDIDKAQAKALVDQVLRHAEARPAGAEADHRVPDAARSPRSGGGSSRTASSCRASTWPWITSPIFKPGDADADIAATILGGGKSSRLYKKLVYEQADRAERQRAAVLADSRLDVSNRGDRAPRAHGRRARKISE